MTFHHRHLIWSRYFSSLHFPTMALYVFCDQSQKMTRPPGPGPPKWHQNYIHPLGGGSSQGALSDPPPPIKSPPNHFDVVTTMKMKIKKVKEVHVAIRSPQFCSVGPTGKMRRLCLSARWYWSH